MEGGIQNEGIGVVVKSVWNRIREQWTHWHNLFFGRPTFDAFQADDLQNDQLFEEYSHIYRRKTRFELVKISAAVMGIEFSYAAETAFVSPTLLSIGVKHQQMTLIWALSPMVGFFVTPLLGSISDKCRMNLGRRRPFILLLSAGILFGLLLVPNGEDLGYWMGDPSPEAVGEAASASTSHSWGVFITIIGTVLLDFDADACQSPARAYLLDVTLPADHARGLSTFTIMAGLGGFMGYSLGGINWEHLSLGILLGGHVRAVFTLVTIIFIICVTVTIKSFKEVHLDQVEMFDDMKLNENDECVDQNRLTDSERDACLEKENPSAYGTVGSQSRTANPFKADLPKEEPQKEGETAFNENVVGLKPGQPSIDADIETKEQPSLREYLLSILHMPQSLRLLCLTNLFCWMAHVCYSLYFTDFVGESVYLGDPKAPDGSDEYRLYEAGIRFGCWGMAMYSLSCALYSMVIENLIRTYGAKRTYVGGLLFNSVGMCIMAMTKSRASVLIFSATAGVMYSTLFTMPYLLVAHYHASGIFDESQPADGKKNVRGLGTDIAIVSSMVFLAQFILSACMGSIITWSGTTTAVVSMASFLSFCGALSATKVIYCKL